MNFKASTRSGLIIAASLWVCATGVVHAAEGDAAAPDTATNVGTATDTTAEAPAPTTHRHKRHAARKATPTPKPQKAAKVAQKSGDDTAAADDSKPGSNGAAIPANVANANAQWPAQAAPDTTSNMAAQADSVLQQVAPQPEQPASAAADPQPNAQVLASDQLNDLDRAATDQPASPPLTLARATVDTPAPLAEESVSQDNSSANSTWDRTSMIGKVFIAFGGMLTMASAVRMFMA